MIKHAYALDVLQEFTDTMTFTPIQSQVCFTLQPVDDEAIEDPSILTLTLSSDDGVVNPVGTSIMTVIDNDCK